MMPRVVEWHAGFSYLLVACAVHVGGPMWRFFFWLGLHADHAHGRGVLKAVLSSTFPVFLQAHGHGTTAAVLPGGSGNTPTRRDWEGATGGRAPP
jgi:hypothetical protein